MGILNSQDELNTESGKPVTAGLSRTKTAQDTSSEAEKEKEQALWKYEKPPKNFIMPKDKATHTLFETGNEIFYDTPYELNVARKGAPPIYVLMMITNDEISTETALIQTQENQSIILNEYDEQVMNAVISFYVAKIFCFTSAQIYRVMNGLSETETPSPAAIKEVTESLYKLKSVTCSIDATTEVRNKKLKDSDGKYITSYEVSDNLIYFQKHAYEVEGETGKRIFFALTRPPLLYQYSSVNRQFITVPYKVLCIREVDDSGNLGAKIPNTKPRIEIRGDLTKHIEMMKHDEKKAAESFRKAKQSKNQPVKPLESYRKTSRNINFENLFNSLNISRERRTRLNHIEYISACLKYWKAIEYIRDYSINKEKKTATIVV